MPFFIGDTQSCTTSNYNHNKNKHKLLLQQDNFLTNKTLNDSSMSNELPNKHLSLQMEKLPEGFVNVDTGSGGTTLTKKDFYQNQQCSR